MKLTVAAIGTRMPDWVSTAWNDYAKRLPADCLLELREIKAEDRRTGKTPAQLMSAEAQRLRASVPPGAITVALDEKGRDITTMDVFHNLEKWRGTTNDIVFFI